MARRTPVSDAELEVLKVLWAAGPSTVRDVAGALRKQRRKLAYNTVLTLLSRLREKGYVATDRRDTAHLFRPVVTREDLLGSSLAALADRICDGTASPLVHALVRGQRFSVSEIAQLRKLLDDLTPKSQKS
jgi:BlaI family transcriptional regulator, penicillinase repressor